MYACLRYSSHIHSGEIDTRLSNDSGKSVWKSLNKKKGRIWNVLIKMNSREVWEKSNERWSIKELHNGRDKEHRFMRGYLLAPSSEFTWME